MLNLKSQTSAEWLTTIEQHPREMLLDHAHCEKKAAGTAMNLIFAYVEQVDFVRELTVIVDEELQHFRMVLDLVAQRGMKFRRLRPTDYGRRLSELIRKQEPDRGLDRCLIAAIIEARSCERFAILRDGLTDRQLADFYGSLFESEARHHATYVGFAGQFASESVVAGRLDELTDREAEILSDGAVQPRMHG